MDETIELVGRFADGWCVPLPGGGFDRFASQVDTLRETATKYGRDPNQLRIYAYLSCFALNDENLLDEALDHPFTGGIAIWQAHRRSIPADSLTRKAAISTT